MVKLRVVTNPGRSCAKHEEPQKAARNRVREDEMLHRPGTQWCQFFWSLANPDTAFCFLWLHGINNSSSRRCPWQSIATRKLMEGCKSCVLFYNNCKRLLVISHFEPVDKRSGETSVLFSAYV